MLKKMILINSANFQFADVDLSKEIFFVGDNASGKTTTTRAIHFLYNGNGEKLGIPRSKSSFAKHYFPHDDSYIIYVFESFFIFTYKRNDTIKRWFSKQEFNINEIIQNGELGEFKTILAYIKRASLKHKPNSIQEYTDILYGKNKQFLDFCIAKIDNYTIFLEVFNMIFNVDKAIVSAADIKKAIQKSLDRKDDVLTIDYEDFIKKLNEFSRAYNFFKNFDSNRDNLTNAIYLKDQLISLEQEEDSLTKAINYRVNLETKEFNELQNQKNNLKVKISTYQEKRSKIFKHYENFETRIKKKLECLNKEIVKLNISKEKFDPLEIEANIELASKYEGLKKELFDQQSALHQLQEKRSSAQKIIEEQIEQLEYKINVIIPQSQQKKFYDIRDLEYGKYEEDKLLIENEYRAFENELDKEIKKLERKILELQKTLSKIEDTIETESKVLRNESTNKVTQKRSQLRVNQNKIDEQEKIERGLKRDKDIKDTELKKHKQRYSELRKTNAKSLANTRKLLNQKIANAKAILHPIPNSFSEFLSNEVEDWERTVYPILDKQLLLKSCDELKPLKLESDLPLGFEIDITNLEKIPTKDEAIEIIKKARSDKYLAFKNGKSVYKDAIAKLDETTNEIIAEIESFEQQIRNTIENIQKHNITQKEIQNSIDTLEINLEKDLVELKGKYEEEKNQLNEEKKEYLQEINKKRNEEIVTLKKKAKAAIEKRVKDREQNIENLKVQVQKENGEEIKKVRREIKRIKEESTQIDEDELIRSLEFEVSGLETKYNKAYDAQKYLQEYEKEKNSIETLPLKEREYASINSLYESREKLVKKIGSIVDEKNKVIQEQIAQVMDKYEKYNKGIEKYKKLTLKNIDHEIETENFLVDLLQKYEDIVREYGNEKSKFRTLIDKLKKLEKHSLIEISFQNELFDEVESITELTSVLESLDELDNFEKNKYESEKKRRHNNFDTFLKNTIPSKLQSFDDLEMDFEKAKNSINRSLSNADFGVIKNIRLETDNSKQRNDTIASLMKQLDLKVKDTVKLYSKDSLFYYDVPRSVNNIDEIQQTLEMIKQKGANGMINLFDTIDLGISYTENGKKIENKQNIKDDSSSGGNILLKVAIAISILTRYAKKTNDDTPFFLIIDEVSKLQSKNQSLIKEYINSHGFKTLFITPDPAYPDPEKALYYTFKNIQEEGETLEIRQMNVI